MTPEITLPEILEAREARVRRQRELLDAHGAPLICFTMNIAGPIKTSPLIWRGFQMGLRALEPLLPPENVLCREVEDLPTGPVAYYSVRADAAWLKKQCVAIEEATPLGRLFDMDVLDVNGRKAERTTLRGCIVCGAPGRDCAARRLHTVPELQAATTRLLTDHFAKADAEQIADLAVQSLLDEVHTTPKPGLVDKRNNGSHRDMDIPLFERSAESLRPYFKDCFQIGQKTASHPHEEAFSALRRAGLSAEKTMFAATNGVNTHKGAIFTMGLLCGALGRLWNPEDPTPDQDALLRETAKLYADTLKTDLETAPTTAGLRLYQSHGLQGIRGEIAAGLPSLREISLPAYERYRQAGCSPNDAGALTLLHLITRVEDTTLYHRGGAEGAAWAKSAAHALLAASPTMADIEKLDDDFIAKNLSPGGSADLLAATYFLKKIECP